MAHATLGPGPSGVNPFAGGGTVERSFQPGGGSSSFGRLLQLALNLGGAEHVTKPFIESSWVHLCLGLISDMASAVPLRLRRDSDPDSTVIESHPLLDLLASPNPFLTGRGLVKGLVIDWYLDGEQFWFLTDKAGGEFVMGKGRGRNALPESVNPVAGSLVQEPWPADIERRGPTIAIKRWRTESAGEHVAFDAGAVAQIKRHNPYSPIRGMGLIAAIMRTIENDFQAQRYDDALLRSGGTPPFAFTTEGELTPHAANVMRERWRERNARAERDQEPLFLGNGVTVEQLGLSPNDMEFQAMRVWYRDLILSAFRVPLVLLGRENDAGFSRAGQEEARLAFHEDVISPLLRALETEINARLCEPLGLAECLFFDDSELREDALDTLIERTGSLVDMGVTFNKAAELAGWKIDPLDDSDFEKPAIPPALSPPDGQDPGSSLPPSSQDPDSDSAPERHQHVPSQRVAGPSGTFTRALDKAAYLKAFDAALQPADEQIAAALERIYGDMLDAAVDGLRAVAGEADSRTFSDVELDAIVGDLEPWRARISDELNPLVSSTFLERSESMLAELGIVGGAGFTSRDPGAVAFLAQKEIKLRETADTLRDAVRSSILRVLTEGDQSVNNLTVAIRQQLEGLEGEIETMRDQLGTRARLIARTETTGVANGARVLTMQANGVEEHEWLSAGDAAVREDHATLSGTVRRVGEVFDHGLRWPGDPNGPASQVVNCRCTTLPVVQSLEDLEDEAAA